MSLAVETERAFQSTERFYMGGPRKGTRERAFAKRLSQALDNHPRCPEEYGRLTWVMRELAHENVSATVETVRKWLAGEMMPRRRTMAALAKVLRVDETWLAMGAQPVDPQVSQDRVTQLEEAMLRIAGMTENDEIKAIIANVIKD